ncbi:hypothetical protein [Klenkia brasiliensis]|uniref:Chromosome partitioning ATPase, Mrp family, contains Fe-S cluster n=1 Tax=Klenkia brasiliensis TaxID=333142 RepID=A0A1G7MUZ2_9ACTN|nr:hypothetical protein [Klenkia brasiliensis]SDF65564.1 Chromosome partitioning ATPase, Mrp family, contains Fe-S cluster [Klenkia brasiliensis]
MTSQAVPGTDASSADDPARRPGGSGRRRRALVGALVGAVVLGAVGGVLAATADPEVSASALVQSYPDPGSVENPTTGAVDGDQAARNATYVETELVSLNSADLAAQVAAAVGQPVDDVQLEAVRVGDSNVITITATAGTAAEAAAEAQSAADLYVAGRQQRLAARITGLQGTVESQITANQQALDALPTPPTNGVDVNEQQRAALAQQNVELLGARDTLQRAAADTGQVAGVIQQATAQPSGALSTAVLTVVAAVLVGALLGGVLAPVVSSLRGRVRDAHDVTGLGVPVLTPDLPVAARGRRASDLRRVVQLQALQLPDGPVNGGSLAVVGPAPAVGTTFTAIAHARHAAVRRPTLLVTYDLDEAAELVGGLREPSMLLLGGRIDTSGHGVPDDRPTELPVRRASSVPGLAVLEVPAGGSVADLVPTGLADAAAAAGWAVVVDAPPLDRSDEALRAALQCRETVVVTAVGASRVADVDRAVQILHGAGATPAGIVVNHAPRSGRRTRKTARPEAAAPAPAAAPNAVEEAPADAPVDAPDPSEQTGRMPVVPAEERAGLPTSRG